MAATEELQIFEKLGLDVDMVRVDITWLQDPESPLKIPYPQKPVHYDTTAEELLVGKIGSGAVFIKILSDVRAGSGVSLPSMSVVLLDWEGRGWSFAPELESNGDSHLLSLNPSQAWVLANLERDEIDQLTECVGQTDWCGLMVDLSQIREPFCEPISALRIQKSDCFGSASGLGKPGYRVDQDRQGLKYGLKHEECDMTILPVVIGQPFFK